MLDTIDEKENLIPTTFLVYTTSISESIELNLIHCLGTEDVVTKYKLLVEKFMQLTEGERHSKVVSYPMLGNQSVFTADIVKYGFKFIGLAVLRFFMGNASSERILENMKLVEKLMIYKGMYGYQTLLKNGEDKLYVQVGFKKGQEPEQEKQPELKTPKFQFGL